MQRKKEEQVNKLLKDIKQTGIISDANNDIIMNYFSKHTYSKDLLLRQSYDKSMKNTVLSLYLGKLIFMKCDSSITVRKVIDNETNLIELYQAILNNQTRLSFVIAAHGFLADKGKNDAAYNILIKILIENATDSHIIIHNPPDAYTTLLLHNGYQIKNITSFLNNIVHSELSSWFYVQIISQLLPTQKNIIANEQFMKIFHNYAEEPEIRKYINTSHNEQELSQFKNITIELMIDYDISMTSELLNRLIGNKLCSFQKIVDYAVIFNVHPTTETLDTLMDIFAIHSHQDNKSCRLCQYHLAAKNTPEKASQQGLCRYHCAIESIKYIIPFKINITSTIFQKIFKKGSRLHRYINVNNGFTNNNYNEIIKIFIDNGYVITREDFIVALSQKSIISEEYVNHIDMDEEIYYYCYALNIGLDVYDFSKCIEKDRLNLRSLLLDNKLEKAIVLMKNVKPDRYCMDIIGKKMANSYKYVNFVEKTNCVAINYISQRISIDRYIAHKIDYKFMSHIFDDFEIVDD